DKTIKMWNVATGQVVQTFEGHGGGVDALAVSPGGALIASGSEGMTVRLWDATAGRVLCTTQTHTDAIESIAFSPDGGRLVSGGADGRTVIADAISGAIRATLYSDADGEWIAITPAGYFVASAQGATMMNLIHDLKPTPLSYFAASL